MEVIEAIIDTETSDGTMAIVHKKPEIESPRRVMIFMDAPGIRPSLHEFACRLAAEGYEVAIPDLWHRHGRLIGYEPSDIAEEPLRQKHMFEMLATLTDGGATMDREGALAALGWEAGHVGAIGFCMGARCVHFAMTVLSIVVAWSRAWTGSMPAGTTCG